MKAPFSWDNYSDQPYQLKDRNFKKSMRQKELFSIVLTVFSALIILPLAYLISLVLPKRRIPTDTFFGMSVNLDKLPVESPKLIKALGSSTLLIRFPLWEMHKLSEYTTFIQQFKDQAIILNIMQDREHVTDLQQLKNNLTSLFQETHNSVTQYQIGTTINRAKWGFFSVHEYLRFYKVAYQLKQQKFPYIKLLGPSVIDFEYHFTAHALFNFFKLKYDGLSALLYVDRRGAPENKQMGFDLIKKIDFLDAIGFLSPKTKRHIYITETNWPISNTAPYAPTSEHECVSEEEYANFMVRYYLLAFASQRVDAVYWHQLVAPGLGLIDTREGVKKRSAYDAYKTMTTLLDAMHFHSFKHQDGRYTLVVGNTEQVITVLWSLNLETITYNSPQDYIDRDGYSHNTTRITIGPSPIYFTKKVENHG